MATLSKLISIFWNFDRMRIQMRVTLYGTRVTCTLNTCTSYFTQFTAYLEVSKVQRVQGKLHNYLQQRSPSELFHCALRGIGVI